LVLEGERIRAERDLAEAAVAARAFGGIHFDLAARFTGQVAQFYDRDTGSILMIDTFGEDSPFHVYEGKGIGVLIDSIPFDRLIPRNAVVFLQGPSWRLAQCKMVFTIDRIRLLSGDLREVDLSLWLNLSGNPDIPRITVSSSEEFWMLYVLNEEGVGKMVSFAGGLVDGVDRIGLAIPSSGDLLIVPRQSSQSF
jgi:hypothetical protein